MPATRDWSEAGQTWVKPPKQIVEEWLKLREARGDYMTITEVKLIRMVREQLRYVYAPDAPIWERLAEIVEGE